VFPFVDRRWRVPFVVVDLLGFPPRILEGPFRLDNYRYRTTARLSELRPIESVPLEEFGALLHFDPWWVFRGVLGVQREWVEAAFATNVAHPFRHQGRTFKIQGLLRSAAFHPGDIDLIALRPAPQATPAAPIARRAKAL